MIKITNPTTAITDLLRPGFLGRMGRAGDVDDFSADLDTVTSDSDSGLKAMALSPARPGNSGPASCQSAHPSRQTSESADTRPSATQRRTTSPRAGPYWPPAGGRTYQTDSGDPSTGSCSTKSDFSSDLGRTSAETGFSDFAAVRIAELLRRREIPDVPISAADPGLIFGEPRGISLSGGMRKRASQCGQMPRFPAKKSLTFNRCPFGQ